MLGAEKLYMERGERAGDATDGLIAAGPLVKEPGTVARRVVLRRMPDDGFAVHYQGFMEMPLGILPRKADGGYDQGQYFKESQFIRAVMVFAERVGKQAERNYPSLYRGEMTYEETLAANGLVEEG